MKNILSILSVLIIAFFSTPIYAQFVYERVIVTDKATVNNLTVEGTTVLKNTDQVSVVEPTSNIALINNQDNSVDKVSLEDFLKSPAVIEAIKKYSSTTSTPILALRGVSNDQISGCGIVFCIGEPVPFDALVDGVNTFDDNNLWNAAKKGYVIPEDGYYEVDAQITVNGLSINLGINTDLVYQIMVNDNDKDEFRIKLTAAIAAGAYSGNTRKILKLKAGDVVNIKYQSTFSVSLALFGIERDPDETFFAIKKL